MNVKLDVPGRTLTRQEIGRRLEEIEAAVMSGARAEARAQGGQPVWVRPAELVRRMWPYLGLN